MVGGGPGAFIGAVHRAAAALDGEFSLVAGAFASTPERTRTQGEALGLDPARVYDTWEAMATKEARLGPDERVEVVSIVTPNHLHVPVARAFLDAGIHVICDKPLATSVDEAETLVRLVESTRLVFALTHNYTGYPMVKEARELVRTGRLGAIRKVVAEYPQGWLHEPVEASGQKQAEWRQDPDRAGPSSALADIGSHVDNLVRYVTGLSIESLCADLTSFVEDRVLEDDASLLVRFKGGARGVYATSQVAVGEENGLRVRVYGEKAGLDWSQETPNRLRVLSPGGPVELRTRGSPYLSETSLDNTRLPPGHPEGFIEAFANVYRNAGRTIGAVLSGQAPDASDLDFPSVHEGLRGMRFIEAALRSSREQAWVSL
ncbi:MAG: Gfo/Idh/MocA family oxidoreductase [Gemmatimonadetes bacterium]|nr:Gfo/Idh/MocA family oxidoreductase [Gemmatimonadota bacterium]